MIGYFNYTVILTYMSIVSASLGIIVSLHGDGHPYMGVFFLLASGLCDAFDGRVARTKKNRTEMEKKYGIQIDSLSDIVAFGVLPVCIGDSMIRVAGHLTDIPFALSSQGTTLIYPIFFFAIGIFYVTASLMRLAWFNVTEEERQATEGGTRKVYEGLPVTAAAIIFPTILLFQFVGIHDLTVLYYCVMLITGVLFISKVPVPKPGLKAILGMIGVGVVEFAVFIYVFFFM